jgi:hypothetical protein
MDSRKRYYYKDPITAAYMAKEFGVKIDNLFFFDRGLFGCEIAYNGIINIQAGSNNSHVKYYVHPESLDTLRPQEEDVCKGNGTEPEHFIYEDMSLPKMVKEIIWRDGKHFFAPEVEESEGKYWEAKDGL